MPSVNRARRQMLPSLLAAVLLPCALLFTGCSVEEEKAGPRIELEVAVFEGGYGIDWHKSVARQYEQMHPDVKIDLWGDPRVDEKLKPRILRRNPPDLVSCILPVWKLIVADKLYPLDEALDTRAYGQDMTWRQSLVPGLLAPYQYEGKSYAMPTNLGVWACWYDRRQFREHGWEVPETWGQFTALCEKIKAAGIAPIAFQGKYPTYAWSTLLSLYQRLVPLEKWYEMQDIKPGAFLEPEFIRAAELLQDMGTKYFEPGAMAMTHTESQLEFVNGRAAMVFCGLWLKNEMKDATPEGFEMACFAVPMVEGGAGDPKAVYGGGGENFLVLRDARHPKEALDFLKYMVSLEPAQTYIRQLDTLSPVANSVKGIEISPELQSAVDVLEGSSCIYSDRLSNLYLEFGKSSMPDALAALLSGKMTPQQCGETLEAAIEEVRENPDIYKPPAMGVPE